MNPDTLRKAVELADGFSLKHLGAFIEQDNLWELVPVDKCPQPVLDALAAQLVRQVDALAEPTPIIVASATAVSVVLPDDAFLMDGNDKGRTENTITAIVESGVLEDE